MSFWLAYRRALAVGSVLVFFTAACDYIFATGLTPIPPLAWIIAFAALAVPLVFTGQTASMLESDLAKWCGLYAGITIIAFMWSSQSAVAWSETRLRVLAVLFLGMQLLVFADPRVHKAARQAMLWCVFLALVLNVVDLVQPLTFSTTLGRSAGLYRNPNISAIALVLGMVMTVELVPRSLRPWFVCLVGAGVLLTFSRGGGLVWLLAVALIMGWGGMRLASFAPVALALAAAGVGVLVAGGWWDSALQLASFASSDAFERLRVGTEGMDPSAVARLEDAAQAWRLFVDRPLAGWGVGATSEWDWFESTHNMYLRHLAEYGIAGLAIMPLLVLAFIGWRRAGRSRVAVWLAGVVLAWSLFSHNVLDERHFLICIALVGAAATIQARQGQGVSAGSSAATRT